MTLEYIGSGEKVVIFYSSNYRESAELKNCFSDKAGFMPPN